MLQTMAGAACATFLITALLTPALTPVARRSGLLDRPGGRRKHDEPVPAIGGVAIFLGLILATTWFVEPSPQLIGLGMAALIIVGAGVADDMFRLSWPVRLAAQCLAALAMVDLGGVRIDHLDEVFGPVGESLGMLATPLAVLATVGIINAVNMADGVDGLAGLLILAACAMLGAAAAYAGNANLTLALALLGGAVGGFLIYNMRTPWNPRARVFLGNAGSELLGLLFACASFRLTQNAAHPVGVQLAPFLLAPALIDCLTLMVRRLRAGVSPFRGDRNHLHHLLLDAGLSPSRVAMALSGVSLAIGCAAAVALKAHAPALAFTLAFAALWAAYFAATGDRGRFVRWANAAGLRAGLIAAPAPLEAWQIAIRAAGGHYRRKSDHPLHQDHDAWGGDAPGVAPADAPPAIPHAATKVGAQAEAPLS
jgi:UDP-GlcNAc:undecaprenyl-phosphate GlcNAc-1-phosphate transferase